MIRLNNQKGAALVIVLLLIVIISIFSMTLFSSAYNSTLQHRKVEESTQLNELVTMGMMNVRKQVYNRLGEITKEEAVEIEDYEAKNIINDLTPIEIKILTAKGLGYKVIVNNFYIKDDYTIAYTSKATTDNGSSSKEKEGQIEIVIVKKVEGNKSTLTWSLIGK